MSAQGAKLMQFPIKPRFYPETGQGVLTAFEAFQVSMPPNEPHDLKQLRANAYMIMQERGLPSPRLENWKYTNLPPAVKAFAAMIPAKIEAKGGKGVVLRKISEFLHDADIVSHLCTMPEETKTSDLTLWHLNNMFLRDGYIIDVPEGMNIEEPLEITITGYDGGFSMPRTLIRLGKNSSLTLIEYHEGAGAYWKNRVSQIVVGEGAHFHHIRLQNDSAEAVYTQTSDVKIAATGSYEPLILTTGAALSRNQCHVALQGEESKCVFDVATLQRGKQIADTTLVIEHEAPNCESRQNVRTVLDGQATGVFQGKIHVHQPAQKTDGYQLSKALILADGAQMNTKPELEIYADDVKCSHGTTTGTLNDDALFYLRSRGLPQDEAQSLLIAAFAAEVFENLPGESLRAMLEAKVAAWLGK